MLCFYDFVCMELLELVNVNLSIVPVIKLSVRFCPMNIYNIIHIPIR